MKGYGRVKRVIIGIVLMMVLTGCTNISDTEAIDSKKIEYEKKISELEQERDQLKQQLSVKESNNINGYIQDTLSYAPLYKFEYGSMVPAYGPSALINTYAIQEESLVIKDISDEFVTVSIEGVLPRWMVIDDNTQYDIRGANEEFYVVSGQELLLNPWEESIACGKLGSGMAVRALASYDGYYFVKTQKLVSPNDVTSGWVKETYLGKYADLETDSPLGIEVFIPLGASFSESDGSTRKIGDEKSGWIENMVGDDGGIWGTVMDMDDEYYGISLPGASYIKVQINEVRFIKK